MKNTKFNLFQTVFLTMLISFSTSVYAQKNESKSIECRIPGLTETQKEKLQSLRNAHLEETKNLKTSLSENKAKLINLRNSDSPDINDLNKIIDENALLRAELMKKREAHRIAVREHLTDEQKEWFNNRPGKGKGRNGHLGMGQQRGYRGNPDCPYNKNIGNN